MSLFDSYVPEEAGPRITAGDHRVKIVKAEYKASSTGKDMIAIEFVTKEGARLFMNVCEGEYFNKIMTNFYDGFGIPRGDQSMNRWIGRTGTAHVALGKPRNDGRQFMEVKYLLTPQEGTQTPSQASGYQVPRQNAPQARQNAPKPAYSPQQQAQINQAANAGFDDGFEDDVF
jgi:hypothetical protein